MALDYVFGRSDLPEKEDHRVVFIDAGHAGVQACVVRVRRDSVEVLSHAFAPGTAGAVRPALPTFKLAACSSRLSPAYLPARSLGPMANHNYYQDLFRRLETAGVEDQIRRPDRDGGARRGGHARTPLTLFPHASHRGCLEIGTSRLTRD